MSFPPLRTSSPLSHRSEERNNAITGLETEPLIEYNTYPADNKEDVKNKTSLPPVAVSPLPKLISPEDYSRGTEGQGPIRLEPDSDEVQATRPWYRLALPHRPNWDISSEDRGTLNDMGRGALIIITTPIALTGMALYACGMIMEGIAMLLKGVGAFSGRILMRRRRREETPNAQWV